MEVWKSIRGFPKYAISSEGRIKNVRTGKLVTPYVNRQRGCAYLRVTLYGKTHRQRRHVYLQRLVGLHFVACPGDPDDYEAHHKNGDPFDNRAANIEWRRTGEHQRYHCQMRYASAPF